MDKDAEPLLSYLKEKYKVEVIRNATWRYWRYYLDHPPNPKYSKISVYARLTSPFLFSLRKGQEVFFSTNVAKDILLGLTKRKVKNDKEARTITQKLYEDSLQRLTRQASLLLFLEGKNFPHLHTAKTFLVLENQKPVTALDEFGGSLGKRKEDQIAIYSQILPFPNLVEWFVETDYLKTDAFQKKGSTLARILLSLNSLSIPKKFIVEPNLLELLFQRAKRDLKEFKDKLLKVPETSDPGIEQARRNLLEGNFFLEADEFLKTTQIPDLHDEELISVYLDCLPVNFLFDKKKFCLVDLETLSLSSKHYALAHNFLYFLIHLPFSEAGGFRRKLITTWYRELKNEFRINEDCLLRNLTLDTVVYSPDTLLNSLLKLKGELRTRGFRWYEVHRQTALYNFSILSHFFEAYRKGGLTDVLEVFKLY